MKDVLDKLISFERALSEENGPLTLLALFFREDALNWDLVIGAPWLTWDSPEDLRYVVGRLREFVSLSEDITFAGVFIIDTNDARLQPILESIDTSNGVVFKKSEEYFDMEIWKAYFITVRKPDDRQEAAAG